LANGGYDEIHLLTAAERSWMVPFLDRLPESRGGTVVPHFVTLPRGGAADFVSIHAATTEVVEAVRARRRDAVSAFLLGAGTAAMAATWIVLARTRCPAELIQCSPDGVVEEAKIPFDISAEFVGSAETSLMETVAKSSDAALGSADTRCHAMAQVLRRAERVAMSDVPVLLEGEPGVEAEALARFIHERSRRASARLVSFPCRAIPGERVAAELFGQAGRFFEAPFEDRPGQIEVARGATLFLDEIAAIPLEGQARLSRLLSAGVAMRLGGLEPIPVDVRVIAGTSRDLAREVAEGNLLEELYAQLSIASIRIPSIRHRSGELPTLLERLLADTNARCSAMTPKRLSPEARSALLARPWPGNVTELRAALTRLVVWSESETISETDVRQHLSTESQAEQQDGILGRPLDGAFRMEKVLDEVSRSYIERALEESGGVKARAVELLGMSNATTLTNWMKRLGIEGTPKK